MSLFCLVLATLALRLFTEDCFINGIGLLESSSSGYVQLQNML